MPPEPTTWELEPHTLGKHLVLQHYMAAWLPIMTRYNGSVLFVDAFAGPGEYSGGEPGSPIIALRALTEHSARDRMMADISYSFIEDRADRAEHLEQVLAKSGLRVPQNCRFEVVNATFDETVNGVLDDLAQQHKPLPPAFVMIDPFGVSGTSLKTIERILAHPKSEVYVSVMYDPINRFKDHPYFEPHLDELFGCRDWQDGIDIVDPNERRVFFFELYRRQLQSSGAENVLHFELYKGQRLEYAIFFGTHSLDGCDKMKQAIWKVVPGGDYRYWGGRSRQLSFGEGLVDFAVFQNDLYKRFSSDGWVRIEDVIEFAKSDQTDFHSLHLKTKTLKPMERDGLIQVRPETRTRKGSFQNGTVLRFIHPPNLRMPTD